MLTNIEGSIKFIPSELETKYVQINRFKENKRFAKSLQSFIRKETKWKTRIFFSVGHTDRKKRNKKVRKKKETKERKTFFPENKIKAKFSILLNRKLCQLKVDRELKS